MMKKLFFSFILLLSTSSLFAQENNYAVINFIGYGGIKKLYLNDQLIATFGNDEIVRYKIYSKGRINVTYVTTYYSKAGVIEINENKEYYFLVGVESIMRHDYSCEELNKETFEAFKASLEKRKKFTYKTIEIEEDKRNPIGNIDQEGEDGPKQGTCFLISKQGYFLTNYHVISGAKNVQVKGIGNDFTTLYGVDVVAFDVDLDLALLKLKNQNITFQDVPYVINTGATAPQGTKAFVLGYPLSNSMGEEIKVSEGIISAKSGYKGSISQYQFSAAVQPGNSGSPLFNDNGDVIGIVDAKLEGAEGAGYAIKSQYIATFLKLIDAIQLENSTTTTSELSLPEKIALLKNNIFIVKTE